MNLVDSCGWLEYLADGAGANFYAKAIEALQLLIVPTVCIYEVHKLVHLQRGRQASIDAAALMRQGIVVELNESLALTASQMSMDYHLPMADSIILATAQKFQALI